MKAIPLYIGLDVHKDSIVIAIAEAGRNGEIRIFGTITNDLQALEKALIRILTEPRNALTKQYEKLFSFEKVKLKFTEGALVAVARKAYTQKTGARGLRAILEEVMLDMMYEIPSQKQIKEVVVTEEVILGKSQPIRLFEQDKEMKSA